MMITLDHCKHLSFPRSSDEIGGRRLLFTRRLDRSVGGYIGHWGNYLSPGRAPTSCRAKLQLGGDCG